MVQSYDRGVSSYKQMTVLDDNALMQDYFTELSPSIFFNICEQLKLLKQQRKSKPECFSHKTDKGQVNTDQHVVKHCKVQSWMGSTQGFVKRTDKDGCASLPSAGIHILPPISRPFPFLNSRSSVDWVVQKCEAGLCPRDHTGIFVPPRSYLCEMWTLMPLFLSSSPQWMTSLCRDI